MKYYLVAYNALSALAWGYILARLLLHLAGAQVTPAATKGNGTASATVASVFSALPWDRIPSALKLGRTTSSYSRAPWPLSLASNISVPRFLQPVLLRARTAYAAIGAQTGLVQSFAVLEVVHASRGWVRSPIVTTAMQVASRLWTVWGVVECFEVVSCLLCWLSFLFFFLFLVR